MTDSVHTLFDTGTKRWVVTHLQ